MKINRPLLEYAAGALISLVAFLAYFQTMCPTVSFIDSGELTTVICTLGIAHPTGYPLFSTLGYIFVHLPLGLRPVYQANLIAALFCSVALFFYFRFFVFYLGKFYAGAQVKTSGEDPRLTLREVTRIYVPSVFGALVLGFSETYWSQALSIEVYSLHLLLLSLILTLFTKAAEGEKTGAPGNQRLWYLFALVLGLGFTNHMSTIGLAPAFLYMYFNVNGFGKRAWKRVLKMAVPFLAGFSAYAYFPIRAATAPVMNWGNPVNLERFMWHLRGKVYMVWFFSSTETAARQLKYFLDTIAPEFAYFPLALTGLGILYMYRQRRQVLIFTLLLFFGCLFYSINYDIHDIDSYFLLAYISVAMLAAAGAHQLCVWIKGSRNSILASGLVLASCLLIFINTRGQVDQSKNTLVEEYSRDMFKSVEKGGIIISYQWDYFVSAAYYLQIVENFRPDVTVIDKELLRRSWYYDQLALRYPDMIARSRKEINAFLSELEKFERDKPYNPNVIEYRYASLIKSFIEKNYRSRPVYVTGEIEGQYTGPYQRVPSGLAFRLYADTLPHTFPGMDFKFHPPPNRDKYTQGILTMYSRAYLNGALYSRIAGRKEDALFYVNKALEVRPDLMEAISLKSMLSSQ